MSSVFSKKSGPTINFMEIPENKDKKLYDEAVEEIQKSMGKKKLNMIHTLKHHVNTWGLSSNNWLADEMIPKFKNLNHIDFSDTVNY